MSKQKPKQATSDPKPPAHLSPQAKEWWNSIVGRFELKPHHLKLLEGAAAAWDSAEKAREAVRKEGVSVKDRFDQTKINPAVRAEISYRTLFARLTRELGLDVSAPDDSRPPRIGGQTF